MIMCNSVDVYKIFNLMEFFELVLENPPTCLLTKLVNSYGTSTSSHVWYITNLFYN